MQFYCLKTHILRFVLSLTISSFPCWFFLTLKSHRLSYSIRIGGVREKNAAVPKIHTIFAVTAQFHIIAVYLKQCTSRASFKSIEYIIHCQLKAVLTIYVTQIIPLDALHLEQSKHSRNRHSLLYLHNIRWKIFYSMRFGFEMLKRQIWCGCQHSLNLLDIFGISNKVWLRQKKNRDYNNNKNHYRTTFSIHCRLCICETGCEKFNCAFLCLLVFSPSLAESGLDLW